MATLDQEAADLEKALATSADEHAKLVAAKQAQEMLLVEHLTNLNISTEETGETLRQPRGNVPFLDKIIRLHMKRKSWQRMIIMRMMRQLI